MVLWRFDKVAYGIAASGYYFYVCVSEWFRNLAYVRGNEGECHVAHFYVFVHVRVWCCVFCLLLYLAS